MVTTSQPHVPSSRRFWVQNTDQAVQAQAGAGHPQTIAMRSHPRNLSLSASPTIMVHRGAGCASPAKKWRPAWVLNAECMIGANPPGQGRPRAMRCSWHYGWQRAHYPRVRSLQTRTSEAILKPVPAPATRDG